MVIAAVKAALRVPVLANGGIFTSKDVRRCLEVTGAVQNEAIWCEEVPGKICLQSEGAYIEFRNIVLRPIVN